MVIIKKDKRTDNTMVIIEKKKDTQYHGHNNKKTKGQTIPWS